MHSPTKGATFCGMTTTYRTPKNGEPLAQEVEERALPLTKLKPDLEVIKQILGYFVQNRKAADTLEGVARWRLLEEQVRRSVRQTERALEWLVEQGLVEEVRPLGSKTPIFRLNPERHDDAVRFLARQKKTSQE